MPGVFSLILLVLFGVVLAMAVGRAFGGGASSSEKTRFTLGHATLACPHCGEETRAGVPTCEHCGRDV